MFYSEFKITYKLIDYKKIIYDNLPKVINIFEKSSFYVNSFILLENGKISKLDEYWGDNGVPPKWRIDMNIGSKIS
mgnify:CR=1 FL=1